MSDLPSTSLKIAVAQMTSSDDVDYNIGQIKSLLKKSEVTENLDIISFPENSLYCLIKKREGAGYQGFNLDEDIFGYLSEVSDKRKLVIHLGSVPVRENGRIYNATVLISPEKKPRVVYKKIHLFDVDVKDQTPIRESDQFEHGTQPAVFNHKGWVFGLSICYDLRFSELYQKYIKKGVHALMVPSAFTVPTGRAHWHVLLRARAIEAQAYVIAAAQAGHHRSEQGGERFTFGHSMVVDPWGQIVSEREESTIGLLSTTLDPESVALAREQIPMSEHRKL